MQSWPKRVSGWADVYSFLVACGKQNGKYFEVFCKHFLLTNPRVCRDYKHVWLADEVPAEVRRKLNIPRQEHGFDIAVETHDGRLGLAQCKFRTNQKEKLHWTGDDLSNWIGISTKADIVLLMTNASGIDSVTRSKASEKDFREVTNSHLLELKPDDIQRLIASISDTRITPPESYAPKPHQSAAIAAVARSFENESRGKLILPCGAGKTLTALWIKEKIAPARTLVLVPSLALLRQFKNDWKSQENSFSEYRCVCSESDIDRGTDQAEAHVSELNAPVLSDPSAIRNFLQQTDNAIIYSTYQSSPKIAAALKGTKLSFDFAIFDEAHRTAGAKLTAFATALDDQKIPIRKRLFMTATPRVVSEIVKNRLNESRLEYLADMNDPVTFGREFYRMSFADAIKQKVLVDYRIVAIGVSDKEVRNAIKGRQYVEDGTAEDIAHNYALEKVMRQERLGHAVTFHSSVVRARDFAERQRRYFKRSEVFHVNGAQSTNERAETLDAFRRAHSAVITNARCLTEGVDVKSIDTVYFCDPRYSKIDIVQASGRALRVSKETKKKLGYIVVPIFHSDEAALSNAIEEGVFRNLVAVVRALADQDARIEDEIRNIAFGDGERAKGAERILIDLGSAKLIRVEGLAGKLQQAIFTQVIQRAIVPFMPFEQARAFARSLRLKKREDWGEYAMSGKKPDSIPTDARGMYKNSGWAGWGDWLGTGVKATFDREYWPFEKARAFVRNLGLKNQGGWSEYATSGKKPDEVPSRPAKVYANAGWSGVGDWIGTTNRRGGWRTFVEARAWVRKLGITGESEWREYCGGKISRLPRLPIDIPRTPAAQYENKGWAGWGDWLGTGTLSSRDRTFRSFEEARAYARASGIRSQTEWRAHATAGKLPVDIPTNPNNYYKDQFGGYGDWLGTGNRRGGWRPFSEARTFARSLNLKSRSEWLAYCQSGKKPDDIPTLPHQTYSAEWKSVGDWLGNDNVHPRDRVYKRFADARAHVHKLRLASQDDWLAYAKSGKRPSDIPSNPHRTYAREWKGMRDWLGTFPAEG